MDKELLEFHDASPEGIEADTEQTTIFLPEEEAKCQRTFLQPATPSTQARQAR